MHGARQVLQHVAQLRLGQSQRIRFCHSCTLRMHRSRRRVQRPSKRSTDWEYSSASESGKPLSGWRNQSAASMVKKSGVACMVG